MTIRTLYSAWRKKVANQFSYHPHILQCYMTCKKDQDFMYHSFYWCIMLFGL